jgi:hypothetical protein
MEEDQQKKMKIDTGLLVGIIAIAISVISLLVYIFQTRLMMRQLHSAVWPRVEWIHGNVGGTYIEVINKGIGPAIISDHKMKLNGEEIKSLSDLFEKLLGAGSKSLHCGLSPNCITAYIDGRVMVPGESFKPFIITDSIYAQRLDSAFRASRFEMEICYCSIYEDCWTSKGLKIAKSDCRSDFSEEF